MIGDDSIFLLHECYNDQSLCHFDASKTNALICIQTLFLPNMGKNVNKTFILKKTGNVLLRCIVKPRLTERQDRNKRTSL